jgi:predicted RNA binding protein YcfA (HicA-like mRNA interferase family)
MGKLKRLSGEEIVKVLKRMGFQSVRQRGSHVIMKKITINGAVGCVVPMHREIATGTLHSLLKQAQISPEEFEQNI